MVTGAGRGIGRALSLALAESGADVALAARSADDIKRVAEEAERYGVRTLQVPTDVNEEGDVDEMVSQVVDQLGDLDVLVNNSGALQSAALLETSTEDWDKIIQTNLRGSFLCMRAAGRHFAEQQSGKVINIASNFAFKGVPSFASYCASKAAIISLTKTAAVEWGRFGVQVNALAPGYIETDINAAARGDDKVRASLLKQIPSGRMGQAEELGPLVVYLASQASDFMTGETIVFDGGQVAK